MTKSSRRRPIQVETEVQHPDGEDNPGLDAAESPLFGVAMLKIAMELKKPNPAEFDQILSGVLRRMNLSEHAFRAYLTRNGGLLRALAQKPQS